MKPTLVSVLLSAAIGTLALAAPAHAGQIVNIQGYSNGSSIGNGLVGDANYVQGGSSQFDNAVNVALKAGDYLITDAVGKPGALYDAWDFEDGAPGSWTTHFWVGATQVDSPFYTLLLDGVIDGPGHYGGFDSEADASDSFVQHGAYKLHLDKDTTVGFVDPDYDLWDNSGGVSLEIDAAGSPSAVPEPTNVMLMLAGLSAMAGVARRRARASA